MSTIALDFDGVLSDYTGWKGPGKALDPPVDGALQAIRDYQEAGFEVCIHTARADSPRNLMMLISWFREYGLEARYLDKLKITNLKPPAIVYLDDRAWCFTGRFPSVEELKNFKTWRGM